MTAQNVTLKPRKVKFDEWWPTTDMERELRNRLIEAETQLYMETKRQLGAEIAAEAQRLYDEYDIVWEEAVERAIANVLGADTFRIAKHLHDAYHLVWREAIEAAIDEQEWRDWYETREDNAAVGHFA